MIERERERGSEWLTFLGGGIGTTGATAAGDARTGGERQVLSLLVSLLLPLLLLLLS